MDFVRETREFLILWGRIGILKDKEGRPLHNLELGSGYQTSLGVQWQDGKQVGVWPNKWKASKDAPEVTYKGIVPHKIAPWVIQASKK